MCVCVCKHQLLHLSSELSAKPGQRPEVRGSGHPCALIAENSCPEKEI